MQVWFHSGLAVFRAVAVAAGVAWAGVILASGAPDPAKPRPLFPNPEAVPVAVPAEKVARELKATPAPVAAPRTEAKTDDAGEVYGPPLPPVDPRKIVIEDVARKLLVLSELPVRRRVRLLGMCEGAYRDAEYEPCWSGWNPDLVLERLNDALRSHALDAEAIPGMFPPAEKPIPEPNFGVTVDDVRLTLQLAEAALLLKEGPATEQLIWPAWNQGDTPGTIDSKTHTANVTRDFSAALRRHRNEPERALEGFVPANWIYRRLREAWLASLANPTPAGIRFTGFASAGHSYRQAPELARLLADRGYLPQEEARNAGAFFTREMGSALRAWQRDNGLSADGILGPKTLATLSRDANRDRQSIVLNLHRARLIPNDMGDRYLVANLPAGEIHGFDGERLGVTMRIVFGRDEDGRRTPIFRDTMEQVVFRPYWWIPNSIAVNETLPLARRDYSYLSRHGYEIVKNFEPATVMRVTRQNLDLVAAGKLTIRQRAGYGNALGLVKFLFPNDHNVYFHDTPQKSLFNLSERDHSHGCVRLQHPGDLAKWVLRDDPDWDEKSIDRAMNAGDRKIVPLKRPIHVFIVYFTAFPALDRETGLRWLPDVYGMDPDALGTLLAAASRG